MSEVLSVHVESLLKLQYQARLWHLHKPVSRGFRSGLSRSHEKGRGIEFHNARLYQPGDDARSIDWRITARKSKTHTREFQEDREHQTFVFLDMGVSMRFGSQKLKSVVAAQVAAFLGWSTLHHGDRVGGVIVNQQMSMLKVSRRRSQFCAWLDKVADSSEQLLQQHTEADWTHALESGFRMVRSGAMVVLIGDLFRLTDAHWQRLTYQSSYHDIVLIHLYDPLEKQLPQRGVAAFSDGRSTGTFDLSQVQAEHHNAFTQAQQELGKQAALLGTRAAFLSTNDEMVRVLHQQGLLGIA